MPEELMVETEDGGRVAVTVWEGRDPAVILCHGKAFNRESFLPYGAELAAAGRAVAVLDFRGYGSSTAGQAGPDAKELDIVAVARWLAAHGHPRPVALGASMGGGAVLRAAARAPEVLGGFITWSTVQVDPALAPAWGALPKLFVVSEREMMHDQTLAMYTAAAEPKRLVEIPGSRHAQQILAGEEAPRLKAAVAEFLAGLG
ncbi:MAG: alpha/beta fold hydrolase [Firmicutes bacterium]|nr:alpha/beta fold hydrolase [Bacillota bacterium]